MEKLSKFEFDLLVQNELEACDKMLQELEYEYNSPDRVARRDRISRNIGRPFLRDDIPGIKNTVVCNEELVRRIDLFRLMGYSSDADALEIELIKRGSTTT